jgi:endonuclease YncB( thermonuclease family)
MKTLMLSFRYFRLLSLIAVLTFSYFTSSSQSKKEVKIAEVTDGDTFLAEANGKRFKVRLFGIDCPEGDQPGGDMAEQYLYQYLNKTVTLVDHGKDRYERVLGDIYLGQDFINLKMVQDGMAWHYKQYSDSKLLAAAEVSARENKKGLWKEKNPIAPWEWRKAKRSGNENQPQTGVYVCKTGETPYYHQKANCNALGACANSNAKLITEKSAQTKGIKKCRVCFK